ncbi:MAG: 16S rRNA (guanine(966)-N(2))-methyltransferase RsmD [Dysgonamonadaceae bacterium]|jgi:16S rRNA (guanine(966)-N(2))-methyltransferase RsmD|nr:16S rRNA (guanine(966)-N(2))-methyltransferase RsmD [Dysgonamonadaceae bacterium]
MRIISGKYKSRRFEVPKSFKARPTTDFAKENLFNVLGNWMDWEDCTALDLFAGTGSISYELLSRGCNEVVCIEKDNAHYAFIRKVKAELQDENLITVKTDAFQYLASTKQNFDFIFADPPYVLKNLAEIPKIVLERDLLNPGGTFVMEHPKEYDFSSLPGFEQQRIYGAVNFSIFTRPSVKKESHPSDKIPDSNT